MKKIYYPDLKHPPDPRLEFSISIKTNLYSNMNLHLKYFNLSSTIYFKNPLTRNGSSESVKALLATRHL